MKIVLAVAVALAAVVAVNFALLTLGGDRHDPVGTLSPVASIPLPATQPPAHATPPRGEDD